MAKDIVPHDNLIIDNECMRLLQTKRNTKGLQTVTKPKNVHANTQYVFE